MSEEAHEGRRVCRDCIAKRVAAAKAQGAAEERAEILAQVTEFLAATPQGPGPAEGRRYAFKQIGEWIKARIGDHIKQETKPNERPRLPRR